MVQLVITDLDGTLLNDQGIITQANIEAIRLLKQKNIHFGIASGRAKTVIQRIAKEYSIYDYIDFIISYNGVGLYEKDIDEDYNGKLLDKNIIKEIYTKLKDMDVSFVVHMGDTMMCTKVTEYTEEERIINKYKQVVVEDFYSIIDKDYPKLMIIGDSNVLDEAIAVLNQYNNDDFNYFKTYKTFLEVISKDLSKGSMLKVLCDMKNIDIKKVVSVGDNHNDLDMIKVSGYGVAMSNAVDELKDIAQLVVGSNNEDGFAQAVKHYI